MKKLFLLVLMFVFLEQMSTAQNQIKPSTLAKIDSLFAHINSSTPGYMVGVVKDGEFLFEKGFGLANLEYKIPIDKHSAFNIASLSKQFTAACVALLILDGKVSLEDPITKYVTDFPSYGKKIKIKHLIYMTSGINDYYYNPRENDTDWSSLHFFDIDTAIAASLGNKNLMYEPGSQWSYSNINFMLLTKVVEKASGRRFSEFAHQKLFLPLDMTNTFVNDDIFQVIPKRVNGYNHRDEENTNQLMELGYLPSKGEGFLQINRNSPHYGGSGIYTNLSDLKKWIVNFQTKEFGGTPFYDLMHQTMTFEHEKNNDAFGLAFGDFNGHEIVWYEGGDWGFSSYMIRFPKNELTVVVLSNLGTGNARQYANRLIDIMVDDGCVELK
ncbi:MAG: serine hydrolase domain-containing protein [Bacteroidota bacterium]